MPYFLTVHQFKGSSASLGAQAIAHLCVALREGCQARDMQQCIAIVHAVQQAYSLLKSKLELFMQLESHMKQLRAVGR